MLQLLEVGKGQRWSQGGCLLAIRSVKPNFTLFRVYHVAASRETQGGLLCQVHD